jgi:hypothetical protein
MIPGSRHAPRPRARIAAGSERRCASANMATSRAVLLVRASGLAACTSAAV